MATSDLATVFDDWAVAWSSHDADKLLALVTDDCIYEDVTTGIVNRSKPELRDFATAFFVAFPDFDVQIRTRFASGSQASAEWIMTGTHTGDLPSIRDL